MWTVRPELRTTSRISGVNPVVKHVGGWARGFVRRGVFQIGVALDVGSVLTLCALALALAVQPWSVLAAVLLLTAERGVSKEIAYVAGWVLALVAVSVVTLVAYPTVPKTASTSTALSWVEIGAGVALGLWLFVRWQRLSTASSGSEPKWLGRLDSMSPAPAFVLGAFLPNYVVVVAAIGEFMKAGLTNGQLALAALCFVVVASLGVAAPLLVLVLRPQDAAVINQRWRQWLVAHGKELVYAVGALVAVLLVVKGIVGLAG
jgi:hypothetical protein